MPEPEAGEWRETKNESQTREREGGTKEMERDIEERDTEPKMGAEKEKEVVVGYSESVVRFCSPNRIRLLPNPFLSLALFSC